MSSTQVSLTPILNAIKGAVPMSKVAETQAFAKAFYSRLENDEVGLHTAEGWANLASDFLEFSRSRKANKPLIRLFNTDSKANHWESQHTVLQIVNDDMPFLVDTVSMTLAKMGIGIHVLGHPIINFQRDKSGKLTGVEGGVGESVMHMEIDRQTPAEMQEIKKVLEQTLTDVRLVVQDWRKMREQLIDVAESVGEREPSKTISAKGLKEAEDYLNWAADDNFILMGYREYEREIKGKTDVLKPVSGTGLGLMRKSDGEPRKMSSLAAHMMPASGSVQSLILTKTNARSTVHRPGYLDYIGVLEFDKNGTPVKEHRFVGLYTSNVYTTRPWDIPIVRQRYEYVVDKSGLAPSSHSGKALRHILESLPRDELFQLSEKQLLEMGTGILGLQERVRSKLFLRKDTYGRFFSALIYIPRDRFNTEVRLRIEDLLKKELNGDHVDSWVYMGESPMAQLHLIVRPRSGDVQDVDTTKIENEIVEIVRNWNDVLRDELVKEHGEVAALDLNQAFGRALPQTYIERFGGKQAANDVNQLAALADENDLRLSLTRLKSDNSLRLKFYRLGHDIPLSDALPVMENMGLRVLAENPYRLETAAGTAYIQDFKVEAPSDCRDISDSRAKFEEAFVKVWNGDAESDTFNKLILCAGMDWKQVAMLRAYCKFLLQTGVPFSQQYMEQALTRYPLLARVLVELFEARFDPRTGSESKDEIKEGAEAFKAQITALAGDDESVHQAIAPILAARSGKREKQMEAAESALLALLDRVTSLDDDRILRSFMSVMNATLRTSYYMERKDGLRPDGGPADYFAFKFDSSAIPDLPKPRPYREIFVYGPRVEGTHLRFGPVARGGLRWSDRREDFRTEVLGLVKAQMVKNTVIVPVGSKGGFVCKQLPNPAVDRDAWFAEGVACYKRFINGLLDITDNLVNDKIVPPKNVVRHDGDDPYLVVAADKGTATFSDTANGIAIAHGFWLGDAFASGGSVGYDHKGMGITARGAWESVKRHFRSLGHDTQTQDFTVVGIGDMSGDVFGNGMLLSKHIRLVAAFDHRDIFIDPNPDSATSYKERQRLFNVPRSSWNDYDKKLISKGGGVFSRAAKSVKITHEMREALGLDADVAEMSPNALINAALKAPVDLVWNGGIGTYVKGPTETNDQVGDRANNAIRINGGELRCKVVGEGGNLGFTQLGRIDAAQAGVILNTDFIDNSAGVDTSDHEVNIKILLNAVVQRKALTVPARNKLVAALTDEVAGLVLNDNYRQNQALSLMERMTVSRLGAKQHFIQTLESQGLLDRQIEDLPTDTEIEERKLRGEGFTRPELAVLLAYSKLVLFPQLLDSDVPEDPYLAQELIRYFPAPLQKKYSDDMQSLRLKREIIATMVTNSTINRMGATFILRMQEDTGRTPGEIAKAFTIARDVLDARALWRQIDALDAKVPESVQIDALVEIWTVLRALSRWILQRSGDVMSVAQGLETYGKPVAAIRKSLGSVVSATRKKQIAERAAKWKAQGVPEGLANDLASISLMVFSFDIADIAATVKQDVTEVAKGYFKLGAGLQIPWMYGQIESLQVDGRWQALAIGALRDELGSQQRAMALQILGKSGKKSAVEKVDEWLGREDANLRFTQNMLAELSNQKTLDFPTLSVAARRLAQLASQG